MAFISAMAFGLPSRIGTGTLLALSFGHFERSAWLISRKLFARS
jgi:hypothetical protein